MALKYYHEILEATAYQTHKIYHNMALIHIERQNFDLAKKDLRRSLEANPNYSSAYNTLGTIYIEEGNTREAEKYFSDAIDKDPFCTIAMLNLGDLYMMDGRQNQAISPYEKILEVDPYHREREAVLYKLAVIYFNQNRYREASRVLDKLIKEFSNKEAYLIYGNIAANLGKFQEAISLWEKGLKRAPDDQRFKDNIQRARQLLKNL